MLVASANQNTLLTTTLSLCQFLLYLIKNVLNLIEKLIGLCKVPVSNVLLYLLIKPVQF